MSDAKLAGLQATIDALACLERSLFHLHQDKAKYHPRLYAAMAEPTVEEILKLRTQIDAMTGLAEFVTPARMYSPFPANPEPSIPMSHQT
jgi:hypothetical protein